MEIVVNTATKGHSVMFIRVLVSKIFMYVINGDKDFLKDNGLMILRDYQLNAVKSIQKAMSEGKSRFLFEMATGTGKTLIAAAVITISCRSL